MFLGVSIMSSGSPIAISTVFLALLPYSVADYGRQTKKNAKPKSTGHIQELHSLPRDGVLRFHGLPMKIILLLVLLTLTVLLLALIIAISNRGLCLCTK